MAIKITFDYFYYRYISKHVLPSFYLIEAVEAVE